jgi:leader peptidase (prepilin peptidase)/N-methyltransferase
MNSGLFYGFNFFIFGAILGSFGNVIIYRYLSNESIVFPNSKCPSCQSPISWYDNIPVLSWLILRGKCRICHKPISVQYPIVEFLSGVLFLGAYFKAGLTFTAFEICFFLWGLLILSIIDLKSYLLPDIFTLPGIFLGLIFSYLNPDRNLLDSGVGAFIGGAIFWLLSKAYFLIRKEEGLGGGDTKLLAVIGAFLGWEAIPFILLVASISGAVAGLLAMKMSQKGIKTIIPFGPYLAFGSVIYLFFGEYFARKYAEFLFPFIF